MPRGGPTTRSSRPTYDLTARDQGAWGEQEAPSRLCTGLRRTALGALLWSRAASAVRYNSEEEIRARITRLPRRHARRRRPSSGPTRKSQKFTPDARLGARSNRAFSLDFDIVMQQIKAPLRRPTSATGQKAKFRGDQRMSALASKADISRFMSNALVCNGHRGLVNGP
jgi:hypothetical protein